jgi:hypothetical protein
MEKKPGIFQKKASLARKTLSGGNEKPREGPEGRGEIIVK